MAIAWQRPQITPNDITRVRMKGAPAQAALLLFLYPIGFAGGVVLAATDLIDGWLARRWKMVTAEGARLDPLADKYLVYSNLIAVGIIRWRQLGACTWVFVALVGLLMAADVFSTKLYNHHPELKSNKFGKAKMWLCLGAILVVLVRPDEWPLAVMLLLAALSGSFLSLRHKIHQL